MSEDGIAVETGGYVKADRSTARVRPPRAFRLVEIASVCACIVLDARLGYEVGLGVVDGRIGMVFALALLVAGYAACDFVAGLVHFVFDSFGSVETRFIGSTFLLPFRSHHERPDEIREHDFVETNGNNAFGALFALVPAAGWLDVGTSSRALAFGVFLFGFTVAVLFTNQIHKWAHDEEPPRAVRGLQRLGVFLPPDVHATHHRPPYGRGYCVTSGLCNALLDPIDFFGRLERSIRRLFRLGSRD